MAPIPYQIAVPESRLEDLRKRLDLATFPDELEDAEWAYGSPLADVKRLTSYWRNTFDWRKAEAKLNELPNFKANVTIDGFGETELHFLHQPSPAQDAVPLLFVHGWPGSYIEVTKMLSSLAGDANGVKFHVVVPSLPNYAWSAGIKKKGFGLGQYAEACHRLMQLLGYKRYVTQGGDWGMYITRSIGLLYPESCLASHINMVRAFPPEWSESPLLALQHAVTPYTEDEQKGRERSDWFANEGSGYRTIQSTKPQTVGYGLTDSPVALLSWIYEKLHDWTDSYPWSDDEILTWISIYWFSQAGPAASLRIYYEATHTSAEATRERVQHWIGGVKLGLCYAPKELTIVPRTWGRTLGPVVFESEKRCGGHFLAYEQPEEVVSDLRAMFGTSGACQDIMKS
ncbi:alpha/beta-hydrolase [Aureobasidium pullulans]|uniref:Alpha/beta-hydrolase n=1 Tax=Aureobasidium pullulans TaxID=5580 RepID=A0A4S9F727_AURPU|nr:alpha/beta-hydrolase [Aureobasidium pullulans]TIA55993.1 alpha/beta-hydrolase [Aureobasidium pullulans]